MRGTLHRSGNSGSKQLAAIDQLLMAGIKLGPAKKRDAINRVLELVPEWTRGDCWWRIKQLRRNAKRAAAAERHPAEARKSGGAAAARRTVYRPWTPADDDRLLNLAGYEPVKRIAQRLDRSVRAVRFRMAALGISARVTDAWSLRALWKMLRVRSSRLSYFIGNGLLEGARCPHIGKLPGGILRSESAIFVPLHPRTSHGCAR